MCKPNKCCRWSLLDHALVVFQPPQEDFSVPDPDTRIGTPCRFGSSVLTARAGTAFAQKWKSNGTLEDLAGQPSPSWAKAGCARFGELPMALVSCPTCANLTPSSSICCVHCGELQPICPDCSGSGRCPACGGPGAWFSTTRFNGTGLCPRCGGNGICPGCQGQKRRFPAGQRL